MSNYLYVEGIIDFIFLCGCVLAVYLSQIVICLLLANTLYHKRIHTIREALLLQEYGLDDSGIWLSKHDYYPLVGIFAIFIVIYEDIIIRRISNRLGKMFHNKLFFSTRFKEKFNKILDYKIRE